MAAKPVTLPTYDAMLWPTLKALEKLGGSGMIQEIADAVIEFAGYTPEQQSVLHGAGPRTEIWYRLAWARTYLMVVAAIDNSTRGIWAITAVGRQLRTTDMAAIPPRVRAMSPRRQNTRQQDVEPALAATELEDEPSAPPELKSTVFEQWRDMLLTELQTLSPGNFEKLCQRVLRESGFTRVEVTGRSGDGGIDGIGVLRISLLSFQVFFQCKRYRGSVGASAIRDFRGAMVGRTDKGLLITTGYFTADAKREATRDGAPVLDLIDGDQLCAILKDLQLGVST